MFERSSGRSNLGRVVNEPHHRHPTEIHLRCRPGHTQNHLALDGPRNGNTFVLHRPAAPKDVRRHVCFFRGAGGADAKGAQPASLDTDRPIEAVGPHIRSNTAEPSRCASRNFLTAPMSSKRRLARRWRASARGAPKPLRASPLHPESALRR